MCYVTYIYFIFYFKKKPHNLIIHNVINEILIHGTHYNCIYEIGIIIDNTKKNKIFYIILYLIQFCLHDNETLHITIYFLLYTYYIGQFLIKIKIALSLTRVI